MRQRGFLWVLTGAAILLVTTGAPAFAVPAVSAPDDEWPSHPEWWKGEADSPYYLSSEAQARILTRTSVVKLRSRVESRAREMQGSGLLFHYRSRIYVLTSEHALFHGTRFEDQAISLTVQNARFGVLKAELRAVDGGAGLALAEVPGLTPAAI